jgi:hypothetical protein
VSRILKENAEVERLRAAAAREFQPLARVVDRLYNALGCNDVMPVRKIDALLLELFWTSLIVLFVAVSSLWLERLRRRVAVAQTRVRSARESNPKTSSRWW